jgi:hypothetical protein
MVNDSDAFVLSGWSMLDSISMIIVDIFRDGVKGTVKVKQANG